MTNGEIEKALADFVNKAGGSEQGEVRTDAAVPVMFEPVTAAPLADFTAAPEPQGSSLDMDTLKNSGSERGEAEDLLREVRGRMAGKGEAKSDAATAAAPNLDAAAQGVAVRVYPINPQRKDAPGPGAKVQIINEATKTVTLTQG
jgi:hypothetical protein